MRCGRPGGGGPGPARGRPHGRGRHRDDGCGRGGDGERADPRPGRSSGDARGRGAGRPARARQRRDRRGRGLRGDRGVAVPGGGGGAGSELRVNSVLHVNSRLEPGTVVPIGWIAAGDPAELFSPDRHDDLWEKQRALDFPGTVYGVPRGTSMRTLMARQAEFYAAHEDDRRLDG
ncbi:hypothetical protein [Actinomadura madurae]|uniref:hypothetical protein n=1 Tax=Actinomadura madurae TaxID=1993 RepID=UPI0020D21F1E|nr:hypothetical protein [Actinomadura madurae]MCP9970986.1 hypothetical protein [Actinomadura madurae]MCQ0004972.1 hypothetical protein [Actinomadura madurae]